MLQKKDILHLLIFDEKIYYLILERIKWVCNVEKIVDNQENNPQFNIL